MMNCNAILSRITPASGALVAVGGVLGVCGLVKSSAVLAIGGIALAAIGLLARYWPRTEQSVGIPFSSSALEPSPLNAFETEYAAMDNSKKAAAVDACDDTFPADGYSNRDPLNSDWIGILFDFAQKLLAPHSPKSTIFAIGQTPAWILAAGRAADPSRKDKLRHLAFSGSWWGIADATGKEYTVSFEGSSTKTTGNSWKNYEAGQTLRKFSDRAPTGPQLAAYRKYLARIGFHPRAIVQAEHPTVIVDYVQRGGGLRSFLDVLFDWAQDEGFSKDQLKAKMHLQLIYGNTDAGRFSSQDAFVCFLTEIFSPLSAKLEFTFIEPIEELTLLRLTNKSDEKRRLIKRFTWNAWNEETCSESSYANNPAIRTIYLQFLACHEAIKIVGVRTVGLAGVFSS